jgi:hypothetical protein
LKIVYINHNALQIIFAINPFNVAFLGKPLPLTIIAAANQSDLFRKAAIAPCFTLGSNLWPRKWSAHNDVNVIGPNIPCVEHPFADLTMFDNYCVDKNALGTFQQNRLFDHHALCGFKQLLVWFFNCI